MPQPRQRARHNMGQTQNEMANALDDLAEFQDFQAAILPKLRAMLAQGKTAEEIYAFASSYAAVKGVSIALTSNDDGKAMTAIQDVLNRTQGKAVEKREITTRFAKLSDEELEAMYRAAAEDGEDEPLTN